MIEYITVRERVATQIAKNMERLVDADNNPVFGMVDRSPLVNANMRDGLSVLGIVDLGDLNVEYQVGYQMPTMRLGFEFATVLMEGDVASRRINTILGLITKALILNLNTIEDTTNAQLTLDVKYVSFEPDISSFADRTVSGVAIFDVLYRVNHNDPAVLA